jgi:hypothetical protein
VPTLTGGKKCYQLIDEGMFYVYQTVTLSYLGFSLNEMKKRRNDPARYNSQLG